MIDDFSSFADIKLFIRSHRTHTHPNAYRVHSRDNTHSSSAKHFYLIENVAKARERNVQMNIIQIS